MGNNISHFDLQITRDKPDFQLWDKGQVSVGIKRTKYMKYIILVDKK